MIDNPPMLTIHRGWARPDPALVAAFRGAQTSHVCDAMEGRGAVDWQIKPVDPGNGVFCGPALTAWAYPADIAAMFGALAEAQPGDVIMLACDGFTATAVIGDLAAGMMKNKGVAAFVTDGLARDRAGIIATGLPLFAKGIVPNSPALNGPGVVGAPVVLGGVHVCPGDIIVGDADGVVVVPQARASEVLETLGRIRTAEAAMEAQVKAGLTLSGKAEAMVASARIIKG
ncbi:MAG: RraA family protein [Alphaproteobacteria bacterium]|nr:RraA family protein [Alphaproteobacteria bacterium]